MQKLTFYPQVEAQLGDWADIVSILFTLFAIKIASVIALEIGFKVMKKKPKIL